MSESQLDLNNLINFHVCNELAEIEKTANKTNIFDVLKITSAEIRHSNMLAWLLNPQNSHGFGDSVFKETALTALLDESNHDCFDNPCINPKGNQFACFNCKPTPRKKLIDILINNDFSDLKVYREHGHIDVLLVSDKNKFVCVIENKVEANVEKTQLQRYAETVANEFGDYDKLFIVFSIYPYDELKCNRYYKVYYLDFYALLQKKYEMNKEYMVPDNELLIRQYIESIRRYLMDKDVIKDSDYAQICKAIYKTHKKAIDDIIKYGRPCISPEVMKIFYDNTKTIPTNENKETVNTYQYIIPEEWKGLVPAKSDFSSEKYLAVVSINLSNIALTDIDEKAKIKMGVHITKAKPGFEELKNDFEQKVNTDNKRSGKTYFTVKSKTESFDMRDIFEDTNVSRERIAQKLISLYKSKDIKEAVDAISKAAKVMKDKNEEWKQACQ